MHCLEYWVEEMGVDGFRFDLASVFARDQRGELMADPPVPWAIESSRILSRVPLIAEAWDAAGLYHVGAFPGMAWAEWNGRYRDVMRRFVRGDPGLIGEVATRIAGSADLYAHDGRLPGNSINFVTCHDGFTLHDLVSYDAKHNEANGEDNRDGTDDNASWNCGVEGETSDPAVLALRLRQAKNLLAMLLLSRGVPMLLAGDEVLRSQQRQQQRLLPGQRAGVVRLAAGRGQSRHAALHAGADCAAPPPRLPHGQPLLRRQADSRPRDSGHRLARSAPRRAAVARRRTAVSLRFTLAGLADDEEDLHVILNMSDRAVDVALPSIPARRWHVALDTSRSSPEDILARDRQIPHPAMRYSAGARSVIVLEARA